MTGRWVAIALMFAAPGPTELSASDVAARIHAERGYAGEVNIADAPRWTLAPVEVDSGAWAPVSVAPARGMALGTRARSGRIGQEDDGWDTDGWAEPDRVRVALEQREGEPGDGSCDAAGLGAASSASGSVGLTGAPAWGAVGLDAGGAGAHGGFARPGDAWASNFDSGDTVLGSELVSDEGQLGLPTDASASSESPADGEGSEAPEGAAADPRGENADGEEDAEGSPSGSEPTVADAHADEEEDAEGSPSGGEAAATDPDASDDAARDDEPDQTAQGGETEGTVDTVETDGAAGDETTGGDETTDGDEPTGGDGTTGGDETTDDGTDGADETETDGDDDAMQASASEEERTWWWLLVLVVLVSLAVLLARWLRRRYGRGERPAAPGVGTATAAATATPGSVGRVEPAEIDYEAEIAKILQAALMRVGWVPQGPDLAHTAREVVSRVGGRDPRAEPLRAIVGVAELVRFAGIPADATLYEHARDAFARLSETEREATR